MKKGKTSALLYNNEWYHHDQTLTDLHDHIQTACDFLDTMDYDVKKAKAEINRANAIMKAMWKRIEKPQSYISIDTKLVAE